MNVIIVLIPVVICHSVWLLCYCRCHHNHHLSLSLSLSLFLFDCCIIVIIDIAFIVIIFVVGISSLSVWLLHCCKSDKPVCEDRLKSHKPCFLLTSVFDGQTKSTHNIVPLVCCCQHQHGCYDWSTCPFYSFLLCVVKIWRLQARAHALRTLVTSVRFWSHPLNGDVCNWSSFVVSKPDLIILSPSTVY